MKPKTILLVDDDEAHVLWSRDILEQHGYEIDSTGSAGKALEMLKNKQYDLIISDLVMPEMSGIELVRSIARLRKGQKAIIMTGHGDVDSFIESVYDLGALEYIIKPVDTDDFVAMVNKLTSPSQPDIGMSA